MGKIYSETDLKSAIQLLESKQAVEEMELKEQFHLTYESLKPLNIIKNIFSQASKSDDLKENIINNTISLTAGYISKITFEKGAKSPLKKLFGSVVMFSVNKIVANNPEAIKLLVNRFLQVISSKKHQ
ncbi:hypothetical protein [Lutibacter sp.]|uniref:hypothetical protein n=1 Tax=Lutibacter sp. TaxID=1925666 RepID=UPI003564D84E